MEKILYNNRTFRRRRKDLRLASTDAEKFLWSFLKRRQMYNLKFFRQYSIGGYILDFYCPEKRLAIEADGSQHLNSEYDVIRTEFLKGSDIKVLRFWNNDILKNPDGVLQKIAEAIFSYPS